VRRNAEGIEMETPLPDKRNPDCRFDDDTGYTFNGTPTLSIMVLVSTSKPVKGLVKRAKWHLPVIGTTRFWSPD
jgi:hypothetical protein